MKLSSMGDVVFNLIEMCNIDAYRSSYYTYSIDYVTYIWNSIKSIDIKVHQMMWNGVFMNVIITTILNKKQYYWSEYFFESKFFLSSISMKLALIYVRAYCDVKIMSLSFKPIKKDVICANLEIIIKALHWSL